MRNGINQRRNERLGFKLTEFHSFGEFVYLQGFIYKKTEKYVNGEGNRILAQRLWKNTPEDSGRHLAEAGAHLSARASDRPSQGARPTGGPHLLVSAL